MSTPREVELEVALAQARSLNASLHRRVQHAEATRSDWHGRGRARLAMDLVAQIETNRALAEALGKIRALAAGWGRQPYVPERMQEQTLHDIEAEAVKALAIPSPSGDLQT